MNKFYLWAYYVCKLSSIEMKNIRKTSAYENFFNHYVNVDIFDDINNSDNIININRLIRDIVIDENINCKIKEKIKVNTYNDKFINQIIFDLKKKNISYICIEDAQYSDDLREIYDPPYILFYKGNIELMNKDIFAVVGSRKASQYGTSVCKVIVPELAKKFVIVSGMAKGIDSHAHRYAIFESSNTIAVMGTAIDNIYPKSNLDLYKEIIAKSGLVISEHGPGMLTKPYHFARRNRIIAGLSKGVLVVEAEEKSGALTTAYAALNENRNVYSIPGQVFSSLSRGTNKIIKEGAKLVENADDITEDYLDYFVAKNLNYEKNDKNFNENTSLSGVSCVNIMQGESKDIQLTIYENKVLDILSSHGALSIDEICYRTSLDISNILSALNKLCIFDLVVELDQNKYAPK